MNESVGAEIGNAVLVVTRKDLFPTDHGAAVKIIRTAEALARLGMPVVLCTDDRRRYYLFGGEGMTIQEYPWWIRYLGLPRPLALLRLLAAGFPFSNAFLYFPHKDISYFVRSLFLAKRHGIRRYLAEFPAYVEPLAAVRKRLGGRIVLCEHNVEYERLHAQIKGLSTRSYRVLRHYELQMCLLADAVVAVSEPDRCTLQAAGVPAARLHRIPHGVDLHGFRKAAVIDVRRHFGLSPGSLLLVYHGTYSYGPNLQAMQFMAAEILPRLLAAGLEVEVLAIGSKAPKEQLHAAIHFAGAVEDLATVLPAADLAVVSLLEGGGTRMKILDYFAAGVPVISTTKGIEGIPATDGVEALICDGAEALVAAVIELATDKQRAGSLRDAALRFVGELSWDSIAQRYVPLLTGVASEHTEKALD